MFCCNHPRCVKSEVFTRMPDRFRRTGVRTDWADANRGGQPVDSFLEGPVFDAAGNLYRHRHPVRPHLPHRPTRRVVAGGRVRRRAERHEVPERPGTAGHGLQERSDGVRHRHRHRAAVPERRNSERFKGVNDLMFDSRGNLYFTDQGQTGLHDPTGRLYRLRTDGQLDLLLDNVPSPNGVALSPDERCFPRASRAATRSGACHCWKTAASARSARSSLPMARAARMAWRWTARPADRRQPRPRRCLGAQPQAEPEVVRAAGRRMSLTNVAFGGPTARRCTAPSRSAAAFFAPPWTCRACRSIGHPPPDHSHHKFNIGDNS